jgi:hypothetical protein
VVPVGPDSRHESPSSSDSLLTFFHLASARGGLVHQMRRNFGSSKTSFPLSESQIHLLYRVRCCSLIRLKNFGSSLNCSAIQSAYVLLYCGLASL